MIEERQAVESSREPVIPSESPPSRADTRSEPSFGQRALRWAFRLLVVVLLGIALGAGIYYGARRVYRDAIEPLQTLDQRMREVETMTSDLSEMVRENRSTAADSVTEFEGRLAVQAENQASMSAQISRLEIRLEDQADAFAEIERLQEAVDRNNQDLSSIEDQLEALGEIVEAGELPAERIERKLQLLRVMNLLTRARLWIEQANYGLASEDISAAVTIMGSVAAQTESAEDEPDSRLLEITNRLTIALETTRTNPSLAEEELEIAWKVLIDVTAPEVQATDALSEEG